MKNNDSRLMVVTRGHAVLAMFMGDSYGDCVDRDAAVRLGLNVRPARPTEKAALTRMLRKNAGGCDCHDLPLTQCPEYRPYVYDRYPSGITRTVVSGLSRTMINRWRW